MFPNLKSKRFTDLSSNKSYTVIDQFENIAILDNKQKIDVKRLLDANYYDQAIDVNNFFSTENLNIFTEKIKSIPNDILQNLEDDSSPAITEYDPEEEKRMILERANKMSGFNINAASNQLEKFRDLLEGDDEFILPPAPANTNAQVKVVESVIDNVPVQQVVSQVTQPQQRVASQVEDPMVSMFKNIKRNVEFKISIDVENKIPRPDFIEMMEDSYELSIIDYLADEFTKKILSDPSIIRDKIKEEISKIVYKGKEKNESPKVDVKEKDTTAKKRAPRKVPAPPTPPESRLLKEGKEPVRPKHLDKNI